MTTTGAFDASSAPGAMQVEHCDIPLGMTLTEWRRGGERGSGRTDPAAEQPSLAGRAPGGTRGRGGLLRALRRS